MNKTAKQQAIKAAWGEIWRYIDADVQDRILSMSGWTYELNDKFYEKYFPLERDKSTFRPLSLKRLETNNGWIRIESEDDLPTDENLRYKVCKDKTISHTRFSAHGVKVMFEELNITHYIISKLEEPPIY